MPPQQGDAPDPVGECVLAEKRGGGGCRAYLQLLVELGQRPAALPLKKHGHCGHHGRH